MESGDEDHRIIVSDQTNQSERFSASRSKVDIDDDKRFLEGIYPNLNDHTKTYTNSIGALLSTFIVGLINDAGIMSSYNHEIGHLPPDLNQNILNWFEDRGFTLIGYPRELNSKSFHEMHISTRVALLRHFHEHPVRIVEHTEIPGDVHVNEDGSRYRILFQDLGQKIRAHLLYEGKEVGLLPMNTKQIPHQMGRDPKSYLKRLGYRLNGWPREIVAVSRSELTQLEETFLRLMMRRLLAVTITKASLSDTSSSEDDDPVHVPTNQSEARSKFDINSYNVKHYLSLKNDTANALDTVTSRKAKFDYITKRKFKLDVYDVYRSGVRSNSIGYLLRDIILAKLNKTMTNLGRNIQSRIPRDFFKDTYYSLNGDSKNNTYFRETFGLKVTWFPDTSTIEKIPNDVNSKADIIVALINRPEDFNFILLSEEEYEQLNPVPFSTDYCRKYPDDQLVIEDLTDGDESELPQANETCQLDYLKGKNLEPTLGVDDTNPERRILIQLLLHRLNMAQKKLRQPYIRKLNFEYFEDFRAVFSDLIYCKGIEVAEWPKFMPNKNIGDWSLAEVFNALCRMVNKPSLVDFITPAFDRAEVAGYWTHYSDFYGQQEIASTSCAPPYQNNNRSGIAAYDSGSTTESDPQIEIEQDRQTPLKRHPDDAAQASNNIPKRKWKRPVSPTPSL